MDFLCYLRQVSAQTRQRAEPLVYTDISSLDEFATNLRLSKTLALIHHQRKKGVRFRTQAKNKEWVAGERVFRSGF
jgi:hypothetical protein